MAHPDKIGRRIGFNELSAVGIQILIGEIIKFYENLMWERKSTDDGSEIT
jgi:hypothetical protein